MACYTRSQTTESGANTRERVWEQRGRADQQTRTPTKRLELRDSSRMAKPIHLVDRNQPVYLD